MGQHGKHRTLVRLAVLLLALWPAAGHSACRQALILGLDISGSVSATEYRLQMDGLAGALLDKDVRQAFLAIPDAPVDLQVFEWSGPQTQNTIIPWTSVTDDVTLANIAATLTSTIRRGNQVSTALGTAMTFAANALQTKSHCWRRTIDLSGDGTSNVGPRPRDIKATLPPDITLNAIVIAAPAPQQATTRNGEIAMLTNYFRSEVIRGPDAFVEAALGFDDFQAAMTRKLLKELETLAVGAAAQTTP